MIRWGAPHLLWLLVAVPALAAAMIAGAWLRRRSLARLADAELVPRLTDSRSPRLALLKNACLLAGLAFLIVAAARPQWGEKLQVYKGRGIDVVVALDASRSMLATDIIPNRLTKAKSQISALLDNLSTDRVGIVSFAGEAQVMCPLTPDVEAAKLFLGIIDPDNMPKPGTNIQKAIEAAVSTFDPEAETSRALVLVTDGESLDGDLNAAVRLAATEGIHIYAIGVGTPQGSTIPEASANGGTSYKKDEQGKIVVSRLAEQQLLVMAKLTDGRYFRSETINLNNLIAALDQLQKHPIGGGEYVEYEEHFQAFLAVAFALLFLGLFLSDRKRGWFPEWSARVAKWRARFAGAAAITLGFALAGATLAASASDARADVGSSMRKGLALERAGKYPQALEAYQQALVLEPDNERIHYNMGRALYQMDRPNDAVDHFKLGLLTKSAKLRERGLYNMGNCAYRAQQLDDAIGFYSQALLLDPGDTHAKENLELCLKKKSESPQKPDSTQKNPQQQPQQQPETQQAQPTSAQKGAIPKDQANRMLQALQSKERENLKKQPKPPEAKNAGGKDW